jgi:hypothetical protein
MLPWMQLILACFCLLVLLFPRTIDAFRPPAFISASAKRQHDVLSMSTSSEKEATPESKSKPAKPAKTMAGLKNVEYDAKRIRNFR